MHDAIIRFTYLELPQFLCGENVRGSRLCTILNKFSTFPAPTHLDSARAPSYNRRSSREACLEGALPAWYNLAVAPP